MSGAGNSQIANITVKDTWQVLSEDEQATLIDVRTKAEGAFVGRVDLSSLGKDVISLEWQSYPAMEHNMNFADELVALLNQQGKGKNTALYFICRSGVRSLAAAKALADRGYERSFNVADGFEGPLDDTHHRGKTGGWKAAGLPWLQS